MHGMLFAIITVLNSGGTYSPVNQANIQTALNAAACGDEIQIEGGTTTTLTTAPLTWNNNCAPGNEVRLTTTKKAFLPDNNTRVTPSYAPLMPIIYMPRTISAAGMPILDISRVNGQTTGMVVDGIAFLSDPYGQIGDHAYSSWVVNMGLQAVCDTVTNTASNLTANHLLFLASSPTEIGGVGGAINMAGTNVTFMNSWLNDSRNFQIGPPEGWGVTSKNGGSNQLIRNNHFGSALSEHIFLGAGSPYCQIGQAVPSGFTIEHNHFYNSLKWYPGSSTFLGTTAWMKNFIECKSCDGVNARWNMAENNWSQGGSQFYAVTLTPRMSKPDAMPPILRAQQEEVFLCLIHCGHLSAVVGQPLQLPTIKVALILLVATIP